MDGYLRLFIFEEELSRILLYESLNSVAKYFQCELLNIWTVLLLTSDKIKGVFKPLVLSSSKIALAGHLWITLNAITSFLPTFTINLFEHRPGSIDITGCNFGSAGK